MVDWSNNVLNDIHVVGETFHDTSIGSHIEEQVNWGTHNAVDNIVMNILECLVDQDQQESLFNNTEDSLNKHNQEDVFDMVSEFVCLSLQRSVSSPFTNLILRIQLKIVLGENNKDVNDELEPVTIVFHQFL